MSTNLNQTLEQYKEKIISQLQKRLKEERLFATGNLYTSFYGEVIGESQLTIYSSAKYAEAAEEFKRYMKLMPDDPMGDIYLESCDIAQAWLNETV